MICSKQLFLRTFSHRFLMGCGKYYLHTLRIMDAPLYKPVEVLDTICYEVASTKCVKICLEAKLSRYRVFLFVVKVRWARLCKSWYCKIWALWEFFLFLWYLNLDSSSFLLIAISKVSNVKKVIRFYFLTMAKVQLYN